MKTMLTCSQHIKDLICDSRNKYHSGNPHYYVYTHSIEGSIFYIGKGSHDRAIRTKGRSKKWYETAFGKQIFVAIIATGLVQEEALKLENSLITQHPACINKQFSKQEPIICFTKTGEKVKIYNKIQDVVKDGFKPDCVYKCCIKERGLHKNYTWLYAKDYQNNGFQYKKAQNHAKIIVQTTRSGEYVRELLTAQAFKQYGFKPKLIQQVCVGKKKTHKNYIFKYK